MPITRQFLAKKQYFNNYKMTILSKSDGSL